MSCPPPPLAKAELVQPPSWSLDNFYKPKPLDDSNNRAFKREANRILHKLNAITANITKHDDSLFLEVGKLKPDLNCLHNFYNEKRHYIKSDVEKDVLHLIEDLDRLMAKYKATYQIGTSPQHLKQEKGKSREKKGKRGSSQLVITRDYKRKRACLIFRSLGGASLAEDFEPDTIF